MTSWTALHSVHSPDAAIGCDVTYHNLHKNSSFKLYLAEKQRALKPLRTFLKSAHPIAEKIKTCLINEHYRTNYDGNRSKFTNFTLNYEWHTICNMRLGNAQVVDNTSHLNDTQQNKIHRRTLPCKNRVILF